MQEKNAVMKGLGLCDEAGYHCDLYMPHKTPFRNKITGWDGNPASRNQFQNVSQSIKF